MAEFTDPYLGPATGQLRNQLGATTRAELDAAEGALTFARAVELGDTPAPATGDLAEFRAIHRHLFQDVYEWAGELRTVDLRKNVAGAEHFLPVSMIDRAAGFAADELRSDGMLRGMPRDRFVDRLSYHYDQWNYIHPFREGNGRTQRLFWNRVAADAGWNLDWRSVQGTVNDAASRTAAESRDFGPLRAMFDQIVTERDDRDRRDVDRLGLRPPGLDPTDAARIAGMDTPTPPRAASPRGRGPADYGSSQMRRGPSIDPGQGLGR